MTQHRSGSEKKGGGRKPAIEQQPPLLVNFLALLAEFTAGDPMREGVLWTNLSHCEISRRLREMGTPASRRTVRKLLRKHGLGQRKARKKKSMGAHPDRNAQFENIAHLKAAYLAAGEPVISIDTKKKELIGNFAREGHTHTQVPVEENGDRQYDRIEVKMINTLDRVQHRYFYFDITDCFKAF